jgi:hypothetical protein
LPTHTSFAHVPLQQSLNAAQVAPACLHWPPLVDPWLDVEPDDAILLLLLEHAAISP